MYFCLSAPLPFLCDGGGGDDDDDYGIGRGSGDDGDVLMDNDGNDDDVPMKVSGRMEKGGAKLCNGSSCRSCFACVFKVLYEFGLNSTAYSELYCIYQFMMTLAVTQIECERSF